MYLAIATCLKSLIAAPTSATCRGAAFASGVEKKAFARGLLDARVVVRGRRCRLQARVIRRGVRVRAGRGARSESRNDRTQLRNSSLKDKDAGIDRSRGNAVGANDLGMEVASA